MYGIQITGFYVDISLQFWEKTLEQIRILHGKNTAPIILYYNINNEHASPDRTCSYLYYIRNFSLDLVQLI